LFFSKEGTKKVMLFLGVFFIGVLLIGVVIDGGIVIYNREDFPIVDGFLIIEVLKGCEEPVLILGSMGRRVMF